MSRGLAEFIAEATEVLDGMERDVAALEDAGVDPPPDLLNAVFRGAHSLKGVAGLFAQDAVATLSHKLEDLLDRLRMGRADPGPEVSVLLERSLRSLRELVAQAARGGEPEAAALQRAQDTTNALDAAEAEEKHRDGTRDPIDDLSLDPQLRAMLTEYEEHRLRENLRKEKAIWRVRAEYPLLDFDARLLKLNGALKTHGEVTSTLPSELPAAAENIAFDLLFATSASSLDALLKEHGATAKVVPKTSRPAAGADPQGGEFDVPAGVPNPPQPESEGSLRAPQPAVSNAPEGSLRSLSQTVRVDIAKLDALMNAVGELHLIKSNLQRLAETAHSGGRLALSKLFGQELA
ncbi:MAG: Hpt domain-containing protein, partial [Myxococcaceae bacterium]